MTALSPAPERTQTKKSVGRGFMAALVVASVLNPMNTSSLATALPAIAREMHADAAATGLLVAVVYIASAVAQPVMGSLTSRIRPQRLLVAGLLLVVAAGVIGALAATVSHILVSRVLIGLGTSASLPAAMVALRQRAEQLGLDAPTRELAALSAAGNVMAAAGLPLGGLLVSSFGWRSVLAVNTPVALLALVLVLAFVPSMAPRHGRAAPARLDSLGITLFTATVILTAVLLEDTSQMTWWALGAALLALTALTGWEWRLGGHSGRQPFIDVHLIAHSAALRGVYLRSFWLSAAVYISLYGVSQWLGIVHQLDAALVGMLMLPQSLLAAGSALWAGASSSIRPLLRASGALLAAGGAALLCAASAAGSGALVLAALTTVLIGLAFGLGMVGNQAALYAATTSEQFGTASGLVKTASYLGGFASTAFMSVAYGSGVADDGLLAIAAAIVAAGALTLALSSRSRIPVAAAG